MTDTPKSPAWLEKPDGSQTPVEGNCSIGRASGNQVLLADERVSRRHAVIHAQGEGEFWLVDLGTSNGTYVNGRRLSQPGRVRHGDVIKIGPFELVFREAGGRDQDGPPTMTTANRTIVAVQSSPCWLLLADIEGSTMLSQKRHPEALAVLIGQWFSRCKEAIEGRAGVINKYLGDGFFAYWPATESATPHVVAALGALSALQASAEPRFRLVLHCDQVVMGGMATLGEESLSGAGVNFVFRMEKLAGLLGQSRLVSEAAARRLGPAFPTTPLGKHPVASFEGEHAFLTFGPDS
jgi:adenylate cyclase